jgi:hypothetical protein
MLRVSACPSANQGTRHDAHRTPTDDGGRGGRQAPARALTQALTPTYGNPARMFQNRHLLTPMRVAKNAAGTDSSAAQGQRGTSTLDGEEAPADRGEGKVSPALPGRPRATDGSDSAGRLEKNRLAKADRRDACN